MNVVELFAGAGGMTEGVKKVGGNCSLAIEFDQQAGETLAFNHHNINLLLDDIRNISNNDAIDKCRTSTVDIVTGGPPCQGFSLAGLRIPDDPKNKLFLDFLRLVKVFEPKCVIFENVSGITSMQNGAVLSAILKSFTQLGYFSSWKVLNCANYGVPQARPRFILIAIKGKDVFNFPEPSHIDNSSFNSLDLFGHTGKKPFVTVKEALSNLPYIEQGMGHEEFTNHEPLNEYQKLIYGSRNPGLIYNHRATKHSEIIIERYNAIRPGQNNSNLATHLQTKKQNVFRLAPDLPARTVTCNFRTDLIHPWIPRGLTVREAARLQGFDDDYRFFGNLTRKAKFVTQDDQVGNAVPPILAKVLLESLKKYL